MQQLLKNTNTDTQRRKTTDAVLTVGQPISMQINAKTNWGKFRVYTGFCFHKTGVGLWVSNAGLRYTKDCSPGGSWGVEGGRMEEEEEGWWANRWLLLPSGRFQCNLIVRLLFAPLASTVCPFSYVWRRLVVFSCITVEESMQYFHCCYCTLYVRPNSHNATQESQGRGRFMDTSG